MSNNFGECGLDTVYYEGLRRFENLGEAFAWERQVFKEDNTWNNGPVSDGIVLSPHMTLRINGRAIPVYASRGTFSAHSYAYAEVEDEAEGFSLAVEIKLSRRRYQVTVLPESAGIKTAFSDEGEIKSEIASFGSFSFVFDNCVFSALTLLVRKKESYRVPEGYAVLQLTPGRHSLAETEFVSEKTVYRFLKGVHYVDCIKLPSDSVLQIERGTILKAYGNTRGSVVASRNTKNVVVCGSGALDFSELPNGGGVGLDFVGVKNLEVRGLTLVNSHAWTVCFTNCVGVNVREIAAFGYRMWSDGIMLSDCAHARIYDCFLRTGDDAAEVKSTSDGLVETDDVIFENVAVWTDKACGFGVVYENNHDTKNVRFRNCSVGFALPNWSDHLGCLTVCAGNNPAAADYDVYFENFEIFYTLCSPVTLCAFEGCIRDIHIWNVKVKHCFHDAPIYLCIKDEKRAELGKIYCTDIEIGDRRLTERTRKKLIRVSVPKGMIFDENNVVIDGKRKTGEKS